MKNQRFLNSIHSFTSQWEFEGHDRHLTFCRLGYDRFNWNKDDSFVRDYEKILKGKISFKVIGHDIFNKGKNHVLIVQFVDSKIEKNAKILFDKYKTFERNGFIQDWNEKVLHLSFWEDKDICHSFKVGETICTKSFRIKKEKTKDITKYFTEF